MADLYCSDMGDRIRYENLTSLAVLAIVVANPLIVLRRLMDAKMARCFTKVERVPEDAASSEADNSTHRSTSRVAAGLRLK